ncbi:MAG: BamA/TamA family outer membrane protein [Candidatus Marinimicrobia bacterium]|nr:BamA/TamA family outer membrane protein [Candidatus Neomarinimicrobiota bacterium]
MALLHAKSFVKLRSLLFALMILGPLEARGEEPVITRIVIEGNQVTREHVIRREVTHPLGAPFDSLLAAQDRNRLYNLRIFEMVAVYARPDDDNEMELVVEVHESLRFLALPIIYRVEEIGWSYGGAVNMVNFQGLNRIVGATITLGGENTYHFQFFDPWIWGNQISLTSSITDRYFSHPVYRFRVRERQIQFGLGKLSEKKTLLGRVSAAVVDRDLQWRRSQAGDADPPGGVRVDLRHRTLHVNLLLLLRTMDIWRDPTNGFRLKVLYAPKIALDEGSPDYTLMQVELAVYRQLRGGAHPTILAWAASLSAQTGEVQFYSQQYLGGIWVRGFGLIPADAAEGVRRRLEAESLVVTAVELRQTIIPRKMVEGAEWGLGGLLFIDVAWGYGAIRPLGAAQPISGFGAGLRLFMPYLDNFAIDLGINTYNFAPKVRFRLGHKF